MFSSFLAISRLYPILDACLIAEVGPSREVRLCALLEELLAAGVTILQYRNKIGSESEILHEAKLLRGMVAPERCRLILNDYPFLAAEAGLDGVHVGQEDMSADRAREIVGKRRIVGLSTHNREQMSVAAASSADYVAIGPVFATRSKVNPDPVVGLAGVRLAREMTRKPVVAIGGITVENCASVIEAGADSVAVISSLFADTSGRGTEKIASDFFRNLR